ncbi:DNA-entry nuclease (Competence-specific nuclease) [Weissella jogaejeotgali]|uniref:DNA-entry nuclease (Competence-specific nuclease) n=1 Tax=Weissella jogaejeotgali TaxID=1631871 RepID=A0A1L6RAA4_9LACO|nr:DNA/RNA non-specific endonuclease [Weissella jogaejeotgali]APS41410.1 DNA-entry nuclease (Competence-specific nuclease) [Weissella jogaejeotgali]
MGRKKNIPIGTAVVIVGLLILQQTGVINIDDQTNNNSHQSASSAKVNKTVNVKDGVSYGTVTDTHPSESLAKTVLTDDVVKQLNANKVSFNKTGAYIVNDNQTNLNAQVNVAPYVQLAQQDSLGRPGVANAFLNRTSRQYQSRSETGSSRTIEPVGWQQATIGGRYNTLYNRGHLIGYALAGSIKSFDPSEANPQNIATQTAWANQASNGNSENTGQNYYETLVRKSLDNNRNVRYRVTPVYIGDNLVPSGNHMEAKSKDGQLQFNVFVPNVQPGVEIDYATGNSTVVK